MKCDDGYDLPVNFLTDDLYHIIITDSVIRSHAILQAQNVSQNIRYGPFIVTAISYYRLQNFYTVVILFKLNILYLIFYHISISILAVSVRTDSTNNKKEVESLYIPPSIGPAISNSPLLPVRSPRAADPMPYYPYYPSSGISYIIIISNCDTDKMHFKQTSSKF